MTMDWVDDRLEQRRWAARRELQAHSQDLKRKRRRMVRGLARVALAVSLVVLSVLAVEIGRKAVVVMHHAQVAEYTKLS
jgi:hypothetical protein